jgi:hypothetical protein
MLQGFEQKNEQKFHFKMKINKEFTEAHKLTRKPETKAEHNNNNNNTNK